MWTDILSPIKLQPEQKQLILSDRVISVKSETAGKGVVLTAVILSHCVVW